VDPGSDRASGSRESLGTRITNRAEEWLIDLNARNHWLFRAYDRGNELWAALVFRGVRERASRIDVPLEGKHDTGRLRFLTPADEKDFADLLARFDFKYLPPHPTDARSAARALRRRHYLPFGIFHQGRLVGYTLVRMFFPRRAATGVWSLPSNHNRGFSQMAVKTTAAFMKAEGFADYVTVPLDNVHSLRGAQWAGWRIVRTNRRAHVLRHE